MSNKYTERAEAVRNLAKQYKSVIDMGEFLNELGQLDNAQNAIKANIEKLHADEHEASESKGREEAALAAIAQDTAQARVELQKVEAELAERQGTLTELNEQLAALRERLQ